jgi:L-seryl-tRNA(Ser) seleniumtransferase
VNNNAAAVLLMFSALANRREVVVSRGELIEIGGSFRMPDVIAQSGARMVEVGTTNRTTIRDYAQALTEQTRVLLMSHPSNYRIVGFTASAKPEELAALAETRGLILVRDLGSGSLCRLAELDGDEPTVGECLAAGAGLVTFSGDKLLGGPQAGIIVGRADLIDRLRNHPLARAFRIDKLSLAALAATLKLYEPPNDPRERVPVLRMIAESRASIGRRALRRARELGRHDGVTAAVTEGVSYAGGGSLPLCELPSRIIRLEASGTSAAELAARLRAADPPVIARVSKDAVNLDLRTVLPGQLRALRRALREALSGLGA